MTDSELSPVHVGDHVVDREDPDAATMLVTGLSPQPASRYTVDGDKTVADYNTEYPAEDDVVEVQYPERTSVSLDRLQTYAFPRSRLKLEAPLHDRDDEQEEGE